MGLSGAGLHGLIHILECSFNFLSVVPSSIFLIDKSIFFCYTVYAVEIDLKLTMESGFCSILLVFLATIAIGLCYPGPYLGNTSPGSVWPQPQQMTTSPQVRCLLLCSVRCTVSQLAIADIASITKKNDCGNTLINLSSEYVFFFHFLTKVIYLASITRPYFYLFSGIPG